MNASSSANPFSFGARRGCYVDREIGTLTVGLSVVQGGRDDADESPAKAA